ncbi:zymogen granule membrane protein 16-like [Sardina pilchardus]|uniref:zymogen granule membrane protein 16-like n=1 Tax=Sardina pilchardus TaxID=27697 RepID=UPI002E0E7323
MFGFVALSLLVASTLAQGAMDYYSFSPPVGRGTGTAYATSGEGRITAVRVWEQNNNQITGFQLKYGFAWTPRIGRNTSSRVDISLFDDEAIVQVSGKYNPNRFIQQVLFVTSRGRFLSAGQPSGLSFNHYPTDSGSELRILSGRFDANGITSLGAHWARVDASNGNALAERRS